MNVSSVKHSIKTFVLKNIKKLRLSEGKVEFLFINKFTFIME